MKTKSVQHEFYVRCPFGLEKVVANELEQLKIKSIRPLNGGVAFFGSLQQGYLACLWLRCASRVLLVLARFEAADADALYAGAYALDWACHIGEQATFAIHARGTNKQLKNTQFTAVKVKDALCDKLREQRGSRPNVQPHRPDVQLEVTIRNTKATLYLDLSGEPLHRRGYREEGKQTQAPLKENLAAGVLLESGWSQKSSALYDPLCGSGTLIIEAAMIAANMAPGIMRDYWGFNGWAGHNKELWEDLLAEADDKLEEGLKSMPLLLGSDSDAAAIKLATNNAKRVGLSSFIAFTVADIKDTALTLQKDTPHELPPQGFVITNPPYGERLMSAADLPAFYVQMATGFSHLPQDWSVHIITADPSIDIHLKMVPSALETLYNGKIETTLRHYVLADKQVHKLSVGNPVDGKEVLVDVLEQSTEQFAARLKKVEKERRKWAKREGITCYRIYDADLPDYSVSVDRYEGIHQSSNKVFACVTEYRAPKEIDEDKARRRYHDVMQVVPAALGIPANQVISKVRERAKGGEQYSASQQSTRTMTVLEGGYRFKVDLGVILIRGFFLIIAQRVL